MGLFSKKEIPAPSERPEFIEVGQVVNTHGVRGEIKVQPWDVTKDELQQALDRFGDDGKNPNPMAKSMSWLKTNVKLGIDMSDATIADLMTDGCNMGMKSLTKYLNEYRAADENAKELTKKLIAQEAHLVGEMRHYL